jgi:hypothetical protein
MNVDERTGPRVDAQLHRARVRARRNILLASEPRAVRLWPPIRRKAAVGRAFRARARIHVGRLAARHRHRQRRNRHGGLHPTLLRSASPIGISRRPAARRRCPAAHRRCNPTATSPTQQAGSVPTAEKEPFYCYLIAFKWFQALPHSPVLCPGGGSPWQSVAKLSTHLSFNEPFLRSSTLRVVSTSARASCRQPNPTALYKQPPRDNTRLQRSSGADL